MEERQFLHRLCTTALQVDVSIEFVGIIDSNGRLLVGKSRKMRHNPHFSRRKITCSPFRNSNHYGIPLFKDKTLSSNNIKSIVSLQSNLIDDDDDDAEFRLINLCDNVFLAYIPINELYDRFLYIYIRTEEYLEDVLLKLDTTFS
ncbi:hypothetical protein BH23THE1_BH23THE1_28710 [soil metagenome]